MTDTSSCLYKSVNITIMPITSVKFPLPTSAVSVSLCPETRVVTFTSDLIPIILSCSLQRTALRQHELVSNVAYRPVGNCSQNKVIYDVTMQHTLAVSFERSVRLTANKSRLALRCLTVLVTHFCVKLGVV